MSRLRAYWQVTAGVLLGDPMPECTRRWAVASPEWDRLPAAGRAAEWERLRSEAHAYAASLEDPARLNRVRVDWVWIRPADRLDSGGPFRR